MYVDVHNVGSFEPLIAYFTWNAQDHNKNKNTNLERKQTHLLTWGKK